MFLGETADLVHDGDFRGVMVMFLIFGRQLIALIFGKVDPEVLASAQTYLFITSMSYPFIALYNSCAALYRAMGNSGFRW